MLAAASYSGRFIDSFRASGLLACGILGIACRLAVLHCAKTPFEQGISVGKSNEFVLHIVEILSGDDQNTKFGCRPHVGGDLVARHGRHYDR